MQNVSANYKRAAKAFDLFYLQRLIIDGAGTYEDDKIVSCDTNLQMFAGTPQIGKAVAGEIRVSVLNPTGTIPVMARLQLYTKACGTAAKSSTVTMTGSELASDHATYSDGNITFDAQSGAEVVAENLIFAADSTEYVESEWLPQGVFFIDTREVTANQDGLDVLTIHGYDAMLKTEQEYASNETVGDNYDTAYVRAIANAIGVEVDDRTWELMGTGYIVPFPLGYTMREILGYIAASYVGCFVMTDEGKLRLVSMTDLPAETNLLIDSVGDVILVGGDSILI